MKNTLTVSDIDHFYNRLPEYFTFYHARTLAEQIGHSHSNKWTRQALEQLMSDEKITETGDNTYQKI